MYYENEKSVGAMRDIVRQCALCMNNKKTITLEHADQ